MRAVSAASSDKNLLGSSRGQIAKSFYMFKKNAVASFNICNAFEAIKRTIKL